ncbi:esterase [Paenibacillus sp. MY03]|jgi:phospholipase/carboxylesterase|uniref:Esterase n=1 Tax=Paenibacillus agaridevorans TaxID=171404 RepID=A0A2R5EQ71_9BACL|nr:MULTISPECIES: dienelactone hydrolase family protein [Paenibacillus]OUS77990.1 esterase [Paenibacillus sp. MY03]GBG08840.1 esterase [Paenibacillus agaridevorans]
MNSLYHYDIHLPANMEQGRKYPVVFTLHGKGSNEKNMFGLVSPLSEQAIIIGIRGNLPLGAGYQYYELVSLGNPVRSVFDDSVKGLRAFIDDATEQYPIDPEKRYVLGFSQGAILAMTLALTMGDALKGIVALNGYVPGFVKEEYPLRNLDKVSVFASHGEFDSVFPIRIGHETKAYLEERAPLLTFKVYPADHGVTEENARDVLNWIRRDAGLDLGEEGEAR